MPAVRPGSTQRPFAEINVTPFVDVVLVLLIIFMVTAPMMQQGIDVDLPDTATQPLRVQEEPLVLTVKKDGKVYVGRKELPWDELEAKLRAIFDGQERKEVFHRDHGRKGARGRGNGGVRSRRRLIGSFPRWTGARGVGRPRERRGCERSSCSLRTRKPPPRVSS